MSAPALRVVSDPDDVITQAIELIKNNFDDIEAFLARESLRRHMIGHAEDGHCADAPAGQPCPAWTVAHLVLVVFPELVA